MTPYETFLASKAEVAIKALNQIARLSEKDCEKYVAKCDEIAVAALVEIEVMEKPE